MTVRESRSYRLVWRIYLSYLLLILGALTVVTWYISASVRDLYLKRTHDELGARAFVISDQVLKAILSETPNAVDSLCDALGPPTQMRITVVDLAGKVISDTHEDPAEMNNHADRPEIITAFAGRVGSSVRFSHTIGEEMMYVASPLLRGDSVIACLRVAKPLTAVDEALYEIRTKIVLGSLVIALLAAVVGLWVSRKLTQPLDALRKGVDQFAEGDFRNKVRAGGSFEVEELSESINHMAEQLDSKINEIVSQKAERDAILGSMVEGVLAVDNSEIVLSINDAATRWFQVESENVIGRTLQETVRNSGLLSFVKETLNSVEMTEIEFSHTGSKERILQARGAKLRNTNGEAIGVVVVMSNITQLKNLDRMRRDFVANVSHELKTPITAIKGFVETLQTDESLASEDRDRFLNIISRQSDRLNMIIDDLLTLSRIEQGAQFDEDSFELTKLENVIQASVALCALKAQESGVTISVDCLEKLEAKMNSQLMEQALVNLIDNAIKHSEPESNIEIICKRSSSRDNDSDAIVLSVVDHGIGIDERHLPRLFERFYRADKARSREKGGTGLGLAIVKHIVQMHGGRVRVASELGNGSVFTITLMSVNQQDS